MDNANIILLALLPFIGTSAGAGCVFFLKRIGEKTEKFLYGFASGVMIAAAVWSLLIPSEEMSGSWVAPFSGFIFGALFLTILDSIARKLQSTDKSSMLAFAVTLHNLPEGMAVGVALAGVISGIGDVTFSDAFALTLGISIQNFPEGAIISLPKRNGGKAKAFVSGAASGIVEPLGAFITILLVSQVTAILPHLLAFAAGAMVHVVARELIPESDHTAGIGAVGASLGFALMMLLDMAL